MGFGGHHYSLARAGWRAGRIGRGLTAVVAGTVVAGTVVAGTVVAGTGLALGGSLAGSQAMAVSKPLGGNRVAGHRPATSFAAGQKQLRGPHRAVAGQARPPRP